MVLYSVGDDKPANGDIERFAFVASLGVVVDLRVKTPPAWFVNVYLPAFAGVVGAQAEATLRASNVAGLVEAIEADAAPDGAPHLILSPLGLY